jgi:hypothetical protein
MSFFFPTGRIKFEFLMDNDISKFGSMTSLDEFVIWTEADGLLHSIDMRVLDHSVRKISLSKYLRNLLLF